MPSLTQQHYWLCTQRLGTQLRHVGCHTLPGHPVVLLRTDCEHRRVPAMQILTSALQALLDL